MTSSSAPSPADRESTGPVSGEDSPIGLTADGPLYPPEPSADSLVGGPAPLAEGEVDSAAPPALDSAFFDALTSERDLFKDLAQRTQAEFENYRRRVATTQADEIDRATGRIVEALLPVLDACEAAFSHGVEGVEPVWSALIGVLQKQGLEALDLQGAEFDPSLADAVMHEPADGEPSTPMVSEVLRTGYRWKGRVLRAAMVKVKG